MHARCGWLDHSFAADVLREKVRVFTSRFTPSVEVDATGELVSSLSL